MATIDPPLAKLMRGEGFDEFCRQISASYAKAYLSLGEDEQAFANRPNALAFARAWEVIALSTALGLRPQPVPSMRGGVGICFSGGQRYADIECDNSNNVTWLISDRQGMVKAFEVESEDQQELKNAIICISQFLRFGKDALPLDAAGGR